MSSLTFEMSNENGLDVEIAVVLLEKISTDFNRFYVNICGYDHNIIIRLKNRKTAGI